MSAEVLKYFPEFNSSQVAQIKSLKELYLEWNAMINVISRKDMDAFYTHHVLHSLALCKYWSPQSGDRVLDIGTGGGFPGIPLAIARPDLNFVLVDSIGKKIKVVNEVSQALGLKNVEAVHERAENVKGHFQISVTRAVSRLSKLVEVCTRSKRLKIDRIYCLKGGDLEEEISEVNRYPVVDFQLKNKFPQEFFETKKVVLVDFRKR